MTFSLLQTQKGRAPWWIARPFAASLCRSARLAARRSDTIGWMAECRHGLLETVTGETRRGQGANHTEPDEHHACYELSDCLRHRDSFLSHASMAATLVAEKKEARGGTFLSGLQTHLGRGAI